MLTLSRKTGQAIVLQTSDGPIHVRVGRLRSRSRDVRLHFEAPATVKILREELLAVPAPEEESHDPPRPPEREPPADPPEKARAA